PEFQRFRSAPPAPAAEAEAEARSARPAARRGHRRRSRFRERRDARLSYASLPTCDATAVGRPGFISSAKRQFMVNEAYPNRVNKKLNKRVRHAGAPPRCSPEVGSGTKFSPQRPNACSGAVAAGLPTRTCATQRIWSLSPQDRD